MRHSISNWTAMVCGLCVTLCCAVAWPACGGDDARRDAPADAQKGADVPRTPAKGDENAPDAKPTEDANKDAADVEIRAQYRLLAIAYKHLNKMKLSKLELTLAKLHNEAVESWQKTGDWPQAKGDVRPPGDKADIDPKELVQALAEPLHPHPAMDGYLKRRLLEFGPQVGKLTPRQHMAMLERMPRVMREPEPNLSYINAMLRKQKRAAEVSKRTGKPIVNMHGTSGGSFSNGSAGQLGFGYITVANHNAFASDLTPVRGASGFNPMLSIVNSGTVMTSGGAVSSDPRYVTLTTTVVNTRLRQLRQINFRALEPTTQFREQFIDTLPRENGMRMYGMMVDVRDRIDAASRTTPQAVSRLVDEAERSVDDRAISRRVREQLYDELLQLYRHRSYITTRIEPAKDHQFVAEKETIQLPKESMKYVMHSLKGRKVKRP